MDSLDGSHPSFLVDSPSEPPGCCADPTFLGVVQVPCVSVLWTWSAIRRSPFLRLLGSQADITKFQFCFVHPVLLWICVIAMMRLLFRILCFLILTPLTVPLLALNLSSRPVVDMYAPLGYDLHRTASASSIT
jgi:hypothetical protein